MIKIKDFEVLILGTDPNAYYMARCCYEAYHKKAYVIGARPLSFTTYSNILNVSYNENMWDEKEFLQLLKEFSNKHKGKILLISTNETYVEFISKNKKELSKKYYFNYPDFNIVNSLTNKEIFYKTYEKSKLIFPNTIYYDCSKDEKIKETIKYPVIIKPANVVMYNHISFDKKKKVYKISSFNELKSTINLIKKNGYCDKLIIQEFIPGGDDNLFDAVAYVNQQGKVEFMSFAQIGLQEHTANMVGNAAVLINGLNTTKGDVLKQVNILKSFLESIDYRGFCEVDMKYDYRDNTFKVLEINARQGRSSYYVTKLGKNLVKVLVDDCFNNINNDFKFLDDKVLLSFVPKNITKKYIKNKEYLKEVNKLWKNVIKPMDSPCDKSFKRFLLLKKKNIQYYKDYKNSDWR